MSLRGIITGSFITHLSFVIHCRHYFTDVILNSWVVGRVLVANAVIWLKVEDVLVATFIVVAKVWNV